jgi:hypothetical protein
VIELANRVTENAPLAVREALAIVNAEISGDEEPSWQHRTPPMRG